MSAHWNVERRWWRCVPILVAASAVLNGIAAGAGGQTPAPEEEPDMLANVHWLGHASVKITGEKVIYVDPYEIEGGEKADLILITHGHSDHLSPDDIAKVRGEQTTFVIPASTKHGLKGHIELMKPGDEITVAGVKIRAIPAYNLKKRFHPHEQGSVGYIFTAGGITYYHAGDTDLIPEMEGLKVDVAFLPVGGTYTMDAEEAARATAVIKPTVAVPIHWGNIVGSAQDAQRFQEKASCEVRILAAE